MKKVILLVLSIIMLVSLVAPVSAEEQATTISEEEAKDLIQKSLDFYYAVRESTDCFDKTQKIELPVFIQYETWNGISTLESTVYYPVIEEKLPGGSYKAMCNYAENIYVTDIAPEAYKYSGRINAIDTDFWYLFREEENGVMYMHSTYNPDFWDGTYSILVWKGFELTDIEGELNTAEASVSVWIYAGEVSGAQQRSIECIFQNTDAGWRIAKSDFSTMMATDGYEWLGDLPDPPFEPDESPSTGDSAGERVAVIGAVSLACIIPTACLMRRRRRSSAE